jgi:hypothetical protein
MSESISLRIRQIIDELFGGNKSEFARIVGISESGVRSYLGNTIPKADVLEKIAIKTAISCEWLVLGQGSMFAVKNTDDLHTELGMEERLLAIIKEKDVKIEEMAKTIGRLEAHNEFLSQKNIGIEDAEDAACVGATG